MNKKLLPVVILGLLAGCAHLPDATIGYYLPKSTTTITVVQTISCDSAGNANAALALTVKPTYMADTGDKEPPKLPIKELDGALSDTDVDVTLTDDGRLKGINSSQTGQAGTVIKDVATVAATLAATTAENTLTWCKTPDGSKPVTLTYTSGPLDYKALVASAGKSISLRPDQGSAGLFDKVQRTFNTAALQPVVTKQVSNVVQTVTEAPDTGGVPVTLPHMKKVTLVLLWGKDENLHLAPVTSYELYLPSEDSDKQTRTFTLHIPRSAAFGTQKFVLGIADSGAISEIHYVKTNGAASALEAGQSAFTSLKPSDADQANAIKAKTDIKYQQLREATCNAKPSVDNCK